MRALSLQPGLVIAENASTTCRNAGARVAHLSSRSSTCRCTAASCARTSSASTASSLSSSCSILVTRTCLASWSASLRRLAVQVATPCSSSRQQAGGAPRGAALQLQQLRQHPLAAVPCLRCTQAALQAHRAEGLNRRAADVGRGERRQARPPLPLLHLLDQVGRVPVWGLRRGRCKCVSKQGVHACMHAGSRSAAW